MLNVLKSTLKNTFIYSIGTFSSRLVGFILIPLYTSHFKVEQYGMMGIMEVSSQILLALLGFSLYNAYFRWYWDKQYIPKQKSILFTIIVFLTFQIALFYLLAITFKSEVSFLLFDSGDYSYLVQLLLLVSGFEALGVIVSTLLRLKEKSIFYTVLQIIKLSVSLIVTIYLIKVRNENIEAVYEAQLIANLIYFVLIIDLLRRNVEFKIEWKIMKDMLGFSLPLVLTSLSGIILNITDRYSLRFLSDLKNVGIYSLGFKIANTIKVFIITSINLALQPVIFKMMDAPNNKRFYSKVMTYYTFGLMFFVLFFALFSSEIIKVLSKNMQYWDAYKIVPILSFSMLFGMLRDVAFTGLNITKKTKIIAVIIIICTILNIGFNILFIPPWHFYGAALATTISQLIFFIIAYIYAQRHYQIPYEINKVILMIALGIILNILGNLLGPFSLIIRLVLKFALILLFPFILYWFRFYEKIELERMQQFWQKWRNPLSWGKNLQNIKLN